MRGGMATLLAFRSRIVPTSFWLGCTTLTVPLHAAEQRLGGHDELSTLGGVACATAGSRLVLGGTMGGKSRAVALGLLGAAGVAEVRHVVASLFAGAYVPGVVTSIALATFGALLLGAVVRERREEKWNEWP